MELQAVILMLHKMAFDFSTAKAYLCNQGGTASLFLLRLACHILNLAYKYDTTLFPAYIPTHLIVKANYLPQGQFVPEWYLLYCIP